MSFSSSQDADGFHVATPGSMLTSSQRLENKIKRKLGRGEKLSGPFAASPAGIAQQQAKLDAQNERIAALEKQVNELLAAKGVIPPKA